MPRLPRAAEFLIAAFHVSVKPFLLKPPLYTAAESARSRRRNSLQYNFAFKNKIFAYFVGNEAHLYVQQSWSTKIIVNRVCVEPIFIVVRPASS
jgi:hypothetical protein